MKVIAMSKGRAIAILLALQLAALVFLTQSWYSISMQLDGDIQALGEYDGATSYATAMGVTLFALSSTLVAALSKNPRWIFFAGALVSLALLIWLFVAVISKDVTGISAQLDRLTGIAKTHGLDSVSIATQPAAWAFLTICSLGTAFGAVLAFTKFRAQQGSVARAANQQVEPSDNITIWDEQRP